MMSSRFDVELAPAGSASAILNRLGNCPDAEMPDLVHDLMLSRRLASVVHALNRRLDNGASRDEALVLLRKMGLNHGG